VLGQKQIKQAKSIRHLEAKKGVDCRIGDIEKGERE